MKSTNTIRNDVGVPNLREAQRLLDVGMRLVQLHHMSKRPIGLDWNKSTNAVSKIDPKATGYGLPLAANNLCSVDPDNLSAAKKVMQAWGLNFEEIMGAGVRTRSTRVGSGGRSTFHGEPDLKWIPIRTKKLGVVLELRANSSNLQDAIPGVVYLDKSGQVCTQEYVSERFLDDPPPLPDDLLDLWQRATNDIDFLHELERLAAAALEDEPLLSISNGLAKSQLAFSAPGIRARFNSQNSVQDILGEHGYEWHQRENRWSSPGATGAPGIRPIPGRDGLWQSDHASDPLCGTFDAWSAHVQLHFQGDLQAAVRAFERSNGWNALSDFTEQTVDPSTGEYLEPVVVKNVQQKSHISRLHPLANFVDLAFKPRLPEFVVDDFISLGLTVIAGQPGVGKTSCLLPLAAAVAHLCPRDSKLRPCIRRHVIWVSEDVDQVERCVAALIKQGWASSDQFREWFHVVPASRMTPSEIAKIAPYYASKLSSVVNPPMGDEMVVKPLVVFDTSNAVIDVENENDNAEIGRAIAKIKEAFAGFALWLIAHIAKTGISNRPDDMTSRGASAWGGDAHQTCFLLKNGDGSRSLMRGKSRFESIWAEIRFDSNTNLFPVATPFGMKEIPLRHAVGDFKEAGARASLVAEAKEDDRIALDREIRSAILELVREDFAKGRPLNKTQVRNRVVGKAADISRLVQSLIFEGWLIDFELPDSMLKRLGRDRRQRGALYALDEREFAEYLPKRMVPTAVKQKIEDFCE